jgi:hypothetical protein
VAVNDVFLCVMAFGAWLEDPERRGYKRRISDGWMQAILVKQLSIRVELSVGASF